MTKSIYDQYNAAFNNVTAYTVLIKGSVIGKIVFKHPKDGAGRLYCYLHQYGFEMVRGFAGGYGYDKQEASLESCLIDAKKKDINDCPLYNTLAYITGCGQWQNELAQLGYDIYQVV